MKTMITCKEATDFISRKEEGKLSLTQRLQLRMHLYICSFCKLFYRQNKIIKNRVAELHKHVDISLTFVQKEAMIEALTDNP
jgi:hypothetical protein